MSPTTTRPPAGDDMWRGGLTLTERFGAAGVPSAGRRKAPKARMHWRRERGTDIARARMLAAPSEPQWWQQFHAVYRGAVARDEAGAPEKGLLTALAPIIAHVGESLRDALSGGGGSLLPRRRKAVLRLSSSFEQILRDRLSLAVTKTLVLELAVAGRAGLLEGKTPEARFTYFCDGLKDPGFAASLLAQYPVLVRRCIAIAGNWEQATRTAPRLPAERQVALEGGRSGGRARHLLEDALGVLEDAAPARQDSGPAAHGGGL